MLLADGFAAGDTNYNEAKQTDNSGNGVKINQYSTTYNVIWRVRAADAVIATYTVNAPAAGTYPMVVRAINGNTRTFKVTVNGTV